MHPQRGPVDEPVGGVGAADQLDRDDRAEAGVADPRHRRVRPSRATSSTALAWARSTRSGRVRRPRRRATPRTVPGTAPSRSRRPLSTSYSSSSRVTTAPISTSECPARYFVAECTHEVGAVLERALQHGSGEGVVDDGVGTGGVRRLDHAGQVDHLQRRVGRALEPDQRGVLAGGDHGGGVLDVDPHGHRATAQREVVELAQAALVGVLRHDDLLAVRDQVEHGGHGREPAGEGQAATSLEGTERVLERRPGGVAVAAVLEVAAGDVRRGHRDRHVQRGVGHRGRTPGLHRQGVRTPRCCSGPGFCRGRSWEAMADTLGR